MATGGFLAFIATALLVAAALNGNEFNMFPQENVSNENLNMRPIIGILAQEPEDICEDENYSSYVAASYVKFAESLGARVVALKYTDSFEILENQMNSINGLILPGGGTSILKSETPGFESEQNVGDVVYNKEYTRYMNVSQLLMNLAVQKNNNGNHFPVFGVCLGFQSMVMAIKEEKTIDLCNAPGIASVQTIKNKNDAAWFKDVSAAGIQILETEKVVFESHPHCFTDDTWNSNPELDDNYLVTSIASDLDGKVYINSIEGRHYPFFGFQYHPEKNVYEWTDEKPIPHEPNAIYWTQYLANQFGMHVKQNAQSFGSDEAENREVIYNTAPLFTNGGYFMQMYCFDKKQ